MKFSDLKCLVVGTGSIGSRHIANLCRLGTQVHVFTTGKSDWDNNYDGVYIWRDYEKALAIEPNLVVVANPTTMHFSITEAALNKGCYVLVEKPMCEDIASSEKLIRMAANRLAVAYNYRFHPAIKYLQRLVLLEKQIGKIWCIKSQVGQYLPDWHPGEDYKKGYAARRDMGGGVIRTLSHEIDYAGLFVDQTPVSVSCMAHRLSELQIDVEDTAMITIKYPSVLSEIHLDMVQRSPSRELVLHGDRGTLIWDDNSRTIRIRTPGKPDTEVWRGHVNDRDKSFVNEIAAMLESVLKGSILPEFGDPMLTMRLIDMAYQSQNRGRVVLWGK